MFGGGKGFDQGGVGWIGGEVGWQGYQYVFGGRVGDGGDVFVVYVFGVYEDGFDVLFMCLVYDQVYFWVVVVEVDKVYVL